MIQGIQPTGQAQAVDGMWDARVSVHSVSIPFRIELSARGTEVTSYFFNGDDKVNPSSQGSFRDGFLDLKFASYATELKATLNDETLTGSYDGGPGSSYPFQRSGTILRSQPLWIPVRRSSMAVGKSR